MPKFSQFSLRNRALVLVLLAILPLLALTLYAYFDQRGRAIREVQRDELVGARNMAITLENLFSNTGQLLTALARLPEVQRRDRAACAALLAGVLGQCPYYAVLLVVDPQGQLLASAPAAPGPVNYADRRWFKEVVQAKALVISEPIIGRFTKKYVYNLAFPILDEAGRFQGAVTAGINLQWLGGLLAKSNLPPTTAIVLSDASHKVFFRYPEPLKYSGRMLHDHLIKEMTGRNEGVSAGVGLPGDERLFAFARLSPPWQEKWVIFGLPRDWAVGPVNRVLARNLIFLGLVALFAVAAAWYGAGLFIVQPVKRLRTVTARLAAGDLSVRSGPDLPPGELGLLAHAFDQMADSLQERKEETQRLLTIIQDEKDKLTALVNSINDEVWFADTQKKFTLANPSALREFGLDASKDTDVEEFAASLEVYRPDGSLRPTEEAPPLRALQGELIRNLEEIIRTPVTGELRHRQVSAAPVRDVNGTIIGSVSVVRDITDLKQAEEALKESEAKYRNLFENMTEEVHFWQLERDEAGRIKTWRLVDANPPTLKTWGRSTINEIKGKTADEIFGPGSMDHYFPVVQKIITEGVPYAFEDYFPNLDKYFRFTSVPLGDFFITTGTDITNIKKAEAALWESEKRLRSFYESDLLGVIYWNVNGEITDANDKFLEMLGYQRADLTAGRMNWRNMTPSEYLHLHEAAIKELGATGVPGPPIEQEYIRKNGTRLPILTAGRLLDEARGDGVSFVLDITTRKQAEMALRQRTAELEFANRELEAFSYSVSHDLKAPIRAIQGFSRMLVGEHAAQLNTEGLRLLNVITSNTQMMDNLINDLLALSRLGRHQIRKSSIDLAATTRQVLKQLQEQEPERDLQLTVQDLAKAWGDPSLINQVMMNLLGNAIKYTKAKKTAIIEVGGSIQGQETVYYVKDNGIGFDARYADKLFGVFQRLHGGGEYEGTGVGLAIVQRIIQRHGGRVWAEGKVNEGATFYFSLSKNDV